MARQRKGSPLVDVSGWVEMETEKAYRFFDGTRTVWLPKSQCEWDKDTKTMTYGRMVGER